jgi:TonB family protein
MSILRLRETDGPGEDASLGALSGAASSAPGGREESREPILASLFVHLLGVIALLVIPPSRPTAIELVENAAAARAFFAPAVPSTNPTAAKPTPVPTAPPPAEKPTPTTPDRLDRVSVGARSDERLDRLRLERDKEVTAEMRKGERDEVREALGQAERPDRHAQRNGEDADKETRAMEREPSRPLMLPGEDLRRSGAPGRLLDASAKTIERRARERTEIGDPNTLAGRQMGALYFDPHGADFTRWINHFKNEVYRNWILPQPALMGLVGKVEIVFQVERDGRLAALQVTGPSGTPAFDRASANALRGAELLPLPTDYDSPHVVMHVTFEYNVR